MEKIIKLNQVELMKVVESAIFNNPNHLNENNNLLEFAKRLFIIDYKTKGKTISIREQRDFFRNLIDDTPELLKEYTNRFENKLISEDIRGISYIHNFFNFIKKNSTVLDESTNTLAPGNLRVIMKNLHKAFDGLGTNEDLALKTIKMINTKELLTQVDQTIKNTVGKKYPKIQSLGAWINDEMSQLDPKQYDSIWGHLTKMGYKGKESNKFLKNIGTVYQKAREGWDWLKKTTLGKFFNSLRDALNSGVGMAAQLAIDAIGPETLGTLFAVPAAVWGLVVSWDVMNLTLGTPEWLNIVFDILCLVTTGVLTNALAPIKLAGKGKVFTTFESVLKWLGETKFGKIFVEWIPKLKGMVSKSFGYLTKVTEWIGSKFARIIGESAAQSLKKAALSAKGTITSVIDRIASFFGKETAQVAGATAATVGKSLSEKLVEKGMTGMKNILGNPSWMAEKWVEKGAKTATVELVDKYAVSKSKDYSLDQIGSLVDKKFGTLYGDMFRFGIVAHDTTGASNKLLKSIKNFDGSDLNKMIKSVKTGSSAIKSGVGGVKTELEVGKEIYYDATKGIMTGVASDPHQYKKVGNQFLYALKNETKPNWKKVSNPQVLSYLKNTLFGGYG